MRCETPCCGLALAVESQSVDANMGNTDLYRPLHSFYLLKPESVSRNIFLVSDGHINHQNVTMDTVHKNSQHTRVFTFGVSNVMNRHLLGALARVGAGAFEGFDSKAKSKWEGKVKSQVAKAGQPGLTSVAVSWQQEDGAPPPKQAPNQITALFSGSRMVVYGFVQNCTSATLSAEVGDQEIAALVTKSDRYVTKGKILHRLAAKAIIRDWEDGLLSSDGLNQQKMKMDLKDYVIKLSKQFCIVTQLTSFIAVEKREKDEKLTSSPDFDDLLEIEYQDVCSFLGPDIDLQDMWDVMSDSDTSGDETLASGSSSGEEEEEECMPRNEFKNDYLEMTAGNVTLECVRADIEEQNTYEDFAGNVRLGCLIADIEEQDTYEDFCMDDDCYAVEISEAISADTSELDVYDDMDMEEAYCDLFSDSLPPTKEKEQSESRIRQSMGQSFRAAVSEEESDDEMGFGLFDDCSPVSRVLKEEYCSLSAPFETAEAAPSLLPSAMALKSAGPPSPPAHHTRSAKPPSPPARHTRSAGRVSHRSSDWSAKLSSLAQNDMYDTASKSAGPPPPPPLPDKPAEANRQAPKKFAMSLKSAELPSPSLFNGKRGGHPPVHQHVIEGIEAPGSPPPLKKTDRSSYELLSNQSTMTFKSAGPLPPPRKSAMAFKSAGPPPPPPQSVMAFQKAVPAPPPPQSAIAFKSAGPPPPPPQSAMAFQSAVPAPSPSPSAMAFPSAVPAPPPPPSAMAFQSAGPPPPPTQSAMAFAPTPLDLSGFKNNSIKSQKMQQRLISQPQESDMQALEQEAKTLSAPKLARKKKLAGLERSDDLPTAGYRSVVRMSDKPALNETKEKQAEIMTFSSEVKRRPMASPQMFGKRSSEKRDDVVMRSAPLAMKSDRSIPEMQFLDQMERDDSLDRIPMNDDVVMRSALLVSERSRSKPQPQKKMLLRKSTQPMAKRSGCMGSSSETFDRMSRGRTSGLHVDGDWVPDTGSADEQEAFLGVTCHHQAIKQFDLLDTGTKMPQILKTAKKNLTKTELDTLKRLQNKDGGWSRDDVEKALFIDLTACIEALNKAGLKSLGLKVAMEMENVLVTAFVLMWILKSLVPELFPLDTSTKSWLVNVMIQLKGPLEVFDLDRSIPEKALAYCDQREKSHPGVSSILELGPNWFNVASKILGF